MPITRTCAVYGKTITQGYVWDGTDTFCRETCAARALDNDPTCVDILIDAGRIEWKKNLITKTITNYEDN